jgi:hypothetical protein
MDYQMKLLYVFQSTMKNVLSFVGVVFGTALTYAILSTLIALIFCLSYKEVAQCPATLFFGGCIALAGGFLLGQAIDESDF